MGQYKQIITEESYDKLLKSGMFWEFHPELTGNWEEDIKSILTNHFYNAGRITEEDYKKWILSTDINEPLPKIKDEYATTK